MAYKLVKKNERKYYKYSYESWEQPLLSENGIMGGDKFAVDQSSYLGTNVLAWKAFDADNTDSADCWHSANGHPAWIGWYNPNPLKITSIQVRNRNSDGSYIKTYNLSYSDNGTTYTDIITGATSPSQSAFAYWTITIPETDAHKYWRLVCTASSGSNSAYTAIQTITITATQYMPVESDETDYDYYEDVTNYKLVKDAGNSTPFVQAPLTSNGTMGGTEPACSATSSYVDWQPYRAFDNDSTGTWWSPASRTDCTLYYYNPDPIKLSSVYIDFGDVANECFSNVKVYGGDNLNNLQELANYNNSSKLSPITIPVNTDSSYRYLAFELTKPTAQTWGRIYDIKLEGIVTPEVAWTQPPFADWIGNNDGVWDTSRLYTCTCDGSHNPIDQGGVASLAGSNNGWHTAISYLPHWVGYYTEPIKVSKFGFQVDATTTYIPTAFHWDGSNDGSTWTTLGSFIRNNTLTTYEEYTIPEANRGMYKYHRLYITNGNNSRYCFVCNVNITATKEGTPDTYYVISRE